MQYSMIIGSGVSEPQEAENYHPQLTWHIALRTVYALTCYTVINVAMPSGHKLTVMKSYE